MSLEEKVRLVEACKDEYGLNRCCEVLNLSKGTWHNRINRETETVSEADERFRAALIDSIREHPEYGWPRLKPEIELRLHERVNHKRLKDRLRRWDLALMRTVSVPAKSRVQQILDDSRGHLNLVKGWDPGPLEMLSGDFTELLYAGGTRKAYLVAWVDPETRIVPGWAAGRSANRWLALESWQRVRCFFEQAERDLAGLVIHTDQDSVFKSYDWLRTVMTEDWCVVSFSEDGARGNVWIESVWSKFCLENHSLLIESATIHNLIAVIDEKMKYYNMERRHSSLDNQPPIVYAQRERLIPESLSLK
jgi:putative transposase